MSIVHRMTKRMCVVHKISALFGRMVQVSLLMYNCYQVIVGRMLLVHAAGRMES